MPYNHERDRLPLQLESLEVRRMLAGNVDVFVNDTGDITIVGDAAANEIALDADDGVGGTDLVITGAVGTNISFNGSTAASQTISLDTSSTVTGNLRIVMKGGDDVVTIAQTNVGGNTFINTLGGHDQINLINVNFANGTRIKSGIGSDAIVVNDSTFDRLTVVAGMGSDSADIQNSDINGESVIRLGASNDTLSLDTDVAFATAIKIMGQSGADSYTGFSSNFTVAPNWGSMEKRATVADSIADQAATEATVFTFGVPVDGFPAAGDILPLTATLSDGSDLPAWLNFDGKSFSGTPGIADAGTVSVTVTASDGGAVTVSDTLDIIVTNTNHAPTVVNPIADQDGCIGEAYSFSIPSNTFDDVDASDKLTLTATMPDGGEWLNFDGTTFSGTPTEGDVGKFTVRVTATDDAASPLSVFADFVIVVSSKP